MNVPTTEPAVSPLTLVPRPYDHPDAAALVKELYLEQKERYGFADPPSDNSPPDFSAPNGWFLVGYADGTPVACGGVRWLDQDTMEFKRLYVRPGQRRRGYGRAMLATLEQKAVDDGAHRVVLETGCHNSAALILFADEGFRPIASYVAGRDPSINRALSKLMTE